MATDSTDSLAAERALYKRLVLSISDLTAAGRFVDRLLSRGSFVGSPELDSASREALQIAVVISYARPFSGNRKSADVAKSLPKSLIDSLPDIHKGLHDWLLTLRAQEFAHSDPIPADVKVWVSQLPDGTVHTSPVHAVSFTRATITNEGLVAIDELISAVLELCISERQRIRQLLPAGQHF